MSDITTLSRPVDDKGLAIDDIASIILGELDSCKSQFDEHTELLHRAEPFFAYVRVNETQRLSGDGKIKREQQEVIYFLTRCPSQDITISTPNARFINAASYMGSVYTRDYGDVEEYRPKNPSTGWFYEVQVLEKCVFEVDAKRWDAVRNNFHFQLQDEFIASLKDLLKGGCDLPSLEPWELMSNSYGLRSRPGLDQIQDSLSRSPLNSRLIISGPPGSGKSTTMIRRLAFKSNYLQAQEEGESTENIENWIAITPNDTLRSYLKEAMNRDGLLAPIEKVRIWDDERRIIARDYLKIVGTDAFQINSTDHLGASSSNELWGYYNEFLNFVDELTGGRGEPARNLRRIPDYYRDFRDEYLLVEDRSLFKNVNTSDEIYNQLCNAEIDLLVLTMLSTANQYFLADNAKLYGNTNNDLLENIKSLHRRQVVVDEAADFSLVQLGCMFNLADPTFQSIMFVGDPLQRMSLQGINSWDECTKLAGDFRIVDFGKDYRQTPKLERIANILANRSAESLATKIDRSPFPLKHQGTLDRNLGIWLLNRILEIYKKNNNSLPTVAIVIPSESYLDSVFELVNSNLNQYGFGVEKCQQGQTSGEDSRVRIFSIDYIKGLEFDAVFFLLIDKVDKPELLDKYLYVGLTRARAFLAVTYQGDFPESLAQVESEFKSGDWDGI